MTLAVGRYVKNKNAQAIEKMVKDKSLAKRIALSADVC